jgi:hypothetical protein
MKTRFFGRRWGAGSCPSSVLLAGQVSRQKMGFATSSKKNSRNNVRESLKIKVKQTSMDQGPYSSRGGEDRNYESNGHAFCTTKSTFNSRSTFKRGRTKCSQSATQSYDTI